MDSGYWMRNLRQDTTISTIQIECPQKAATLPAVEQRDKLGVY